MQFELVTAALTDPIPHLGKDAFGFHKFSYLLFFHCTNIIRHLWYAEMIIKRTHIQFPTASCEVHIREAHEHRTRDNLPKDAEDQKDDQANISGYESRSVPWSLQKYLESVEHDDDADEKYAEIAGVRLEGRLVGQGIPIDPMICEPLVKAHVCDQDDVPCDEACDRCDMGDRLKDGTSVVVDI